MKFEIIPTPTFEKSLKKLAKRYRSIKSDISEFVKSLQENPLQGDELTPGIRKVRMAIKSKGKGKSAGARVITYSVVVSENEGEIYLIDIYDKSDFSTVDVDKLKEIVTKM